MVTVPAHTFCAPARAKLIAALRSMPGIEVVAGDDADAVVLPTLGVIVAMIVGTFHGRCSRENPSPSLARPSPSHQAIRRRTSRGVGRNHAASAAGAVTERGRNDQGALAAHFHGGDALVPASDHLALPDWKLERLLAINR